ncbi:hypothetical protein BGX38DRAFT_1149861 [Terfezia claveryi]|nr:hypothetical protein BGX38DRAFT_1149861 [Terfezia claveryi]
MRRPYSDICRGNVTSTKKKVAVLVGAPPGYLHVIEPGLKIGPRYCMLRYMHMYIHTECMHAYVHTCIYAYRVHTCIYAHGHSAVR